MEIKQTPVVELSVVVAARERIREVIASGGDQSRSVIGLTLAILAQEMGEHETANKLIDEYDLEKSYGIEKLDKSDEKS